MTVFVIRRHFTDTGNDRYITRDDGLTKDIKQAKRFRSEKAARAHADKWSRVPNNNAHCYVEEV